MARWKHPKPSDCKQQTLFGGATATRPGIGGQGSGKAGESTLPANESRTSQAAARAMRPAVGGQLSRVLQCVVLAGGEGVTNEQIVERCQIKLQSVCARANDLAKRGLIRDSGRERKTSSGHPARVWVAAEVGSRRPAEIHHGDTEGHGV